MRPWHDEAGTGGPSLSSRRLDPRTSLVSTRIGLPQILLISNEVMHYRVPVYNYMHRQFRQHGYEFSVLTNSVQRENHHAPNFDCEVLPFNFRAYRTRIIASRPTAVILFLHLKDRIIWPLAHWLKLRRIPFAFWTKGGNWDDPESRSKYCVFNYVHALSDALILYSAACRDYIHSRFHRKAFVANNTLDFGSSHVLRRRRRQSSGTSESPFPRSSCLWVTCPPITGGRESTT